MNPDWFMQRGVQTSIFARLDFRTKIWMMFILSLIAFMWNNPLMNVSLVVVIIGLSLLAGIRWQYIRFILVVMLPFILFVIATHGFFNIEQVKNLTGRETLRMIFAFPQTWQIIGGRGLSLEGLLYGINVSAKMLTMTLVVPLGVFTTEVDAMVVSLVKVKIPYRFVFIFSSAMRFFPLLVKEVGLIREAQKLRGLDLDKLGWVKRIRVFGGMAVPLILGAMVKSQKLEVVLQSKAFSGSSTRTYLHTAQMRLVDYGMIVFFALFLLVSLGMYLFLGIGKFVV